MVPSSLAPAVTGPVPAPPPPRGDLKSLAHQLLPYQVPEAVKADSNPRAATDPRNPKVKIEAPELEQLKELVKELGYRLSYGLYEGTEEFYAKVTDPRTEKVVRVIPPEVLLELHARLQEGLGSLIDERV